MTTQDCPAKRECSSTAGHTNKDTPFSRCLQLLHWHTQAVCVFKTNTSRRSTSHRLQYSLECLLHSRATILFECLLQSRVDAPHTHTYNNKPLTGQLSVNNTAHHSEPRNFLVNNTAPKTVMDEEQHLDVPNWVNPKVRPKRRGRITGQLTSWQAS